MAPLSRSDSFSLQYILLRRWKMSKLSWYATTVTQRGLGPLGKWTKSTLRCKGVVFEAEKVMTKKQLFHRRSHLQKKKITKYLLHYSFVYYATTVSMYLCVYRPFHKTLPRSSAFVNLISVRFYETDCTSCLATVRCLLCVITIRKLLYNCKMCNCKMFIICNYSKKVVA